MYFILLAIATVILLTIALQDFRSRAVQWFLFPALALTGLLLSWNASWLPNLIFLLLQLGLLKTWFLLKKRISSHPIKPYIGWGDILFLMAACFLLSPFNFVLYYIGSLLFTLIVWCIACWKLPQITNTRSVPLAGLQAVFLCLYITVSLLSRHAITNDTWLETTFLDSKLVDL